ncbi:choline transport protein, partial [Aspergillus flavus]
WGLLILKRIAGGLVILFLSLFVVIGFLVGRAATTASNSFVWSQFENRSGFSSNGYCTLLGIGIALYAYGNPHWICSLSDDVENAARAVPIAFVAQQIGNLVTVFAFLVTAGYVITDYDALVESHFPSAIGATFEQALGSQVGAMVLLLLIAVPGLVGLMSYYNVCMMVADAFLRTHSMPGWEWLTRRHPGPNVPLNILYCLTVINLLLGFIYLASAEGFSILLGAPGVLYFAGYLVPLVAHVVTKGKNLGHGGWFKMPRKLSVGLAAFNTLTMLFIVICLCLPRSSPITAANMNWSVLFLVFGIASSIVLWTSYGRSNYEGVNLAVADAIEIEATDTTDAESGQIHKSTKNLSYELERYDSGWFHDRPGIHPCPHPIDDDDDGDEDKWGRIW